MKECREIERQRFAATRSRAHDSARRASRRCRAKDRSRCTELKIGKLKRTWPSGIKECIENAELNRIEDCTLTHLLYEGVRDTCRVEMLWGGE